jgi:ABC-type glycerol-3-phosphate transport system substrate-binding protein
MRIRAWSVLAVVLLLAACGGVSGVGQKSGSPPDTSNIEIHGDASADVNKLAVEAIADLQDYWGKEFPHLYGKDYAPVKGGFFAVIPSSGDLAVRIGCQ